MSFYIESISSYNFLYNWSRFRFKNIFIGKNNNVLILGGGLELAMSCDMLLAS